MTYNVFSGTETLLTYLLTYLPIERRVLLMTTMMSGVQVVVTHTTRLLSAVCHSSSRRCYRHYTMHSIRSG